MFMLLNYKLKFHVLSNGALGFAVRLIFIFYRKMDKAIHGNFLFIY
jgi:putative solute:sodium symporter small subunit